jgi:hypothetical protein
MRVNRDRRGPQARPCPLRAKAFRAEGAAPLDVNSSQRLVERFTVPFQKTSPDIVSLLRVEGGIFRPPDHIVLSLSSRPAS